MPKRKHKPKWVQKLEQALVAQGMSKADVAKAIGLSPSTLSNYITMPDGRRYLDRGYQLARAVGVSSDWLWDDTREWPPGSSLTAQKPELREAVAEAVAELMRSAIADLRQTGEPPGQAAPNKRRSTPAPRRKTARKPR